MSQPTRESRCEMLEGVGPDEKAAELVTRLRERKVI